MKKTELTFMEGFTSTRGVDAAKKGEVQKVFNWDKAANIIKIKYKKYSKLFAEAGLQRDWEHTAGIIFNNGKPTNKNYTYLSSNWAITTLILSYNNKEKEIECWLEEDRDNRFHRDSKWDKISLDILGINF